MRIPAFLFALLALAGCQSVRPPEAAAPNLSAEASYHAMWWSPEQMNGMNPNAPPPKNTDVKLEKWEYSDPIGVPHPDVVDLTIVVENRSDAPARNIAVQVGSRWNIGPQTDRSKAAWSSDTFAPVQKVDVPSLAAHERRTVKVPIDLAAKMKPLEDAGSWPWALETETTVSAEGLATPVTLRAMLPITPGE